MTFRDKIHAILRSRIHETTEDPAQALKEAMEVIDQEVPELMVMEVD